MTDDGTRPEERPDAAIPILCIPTLLVAVSDSATTWDYDA